MPRIPRYEYGRETFKLERRTLWHDRMHGAEWLEHADTAIGRSAAQSKRPDPSQRITNACSRIATATLSNAATPRRRQTRAGRGDHTAANRSACKYSCDFRLLRGAAGACHFAARGEATRSGRDRALRLGY